jgi:purine-binding chemotaxis protein CheW
MDTFTVHTDMLQFVTFKLAGQKYAMDILKVQEINNLKEITPVPNAPAYVEGAINLRGKVIPVLNLRKKFHLEQKDLGESNKIIIIDIRGTITGIIVDAVSDVLRVPEDVVEPPPPVSSSVRSELIRGVAKLADGLIIVLDMDRLLDDAERHAVLASSQGQAR